jgi:hypothetical protein
MPEPRSGPSAKQLDRNCARVSRRRKAECHRLMAAAAGYLQAANRFGSVIEAMATNGREFPGAHRFNLKGTLARNLGTQKVFALWLSQALREQETAGARLAREMRRAHVNIQLPRARAAEFASKLGRMNWAHSPAITRLEHETGLHDKQLRGLARLIFKRVLGAGVPFDLHAQLLRKLSIEGLLQDYRNLSLWEVYYLVVDSPADKSVQTRLTDDLNVAHGACTPADRQAPISDFIAVAHSRVSGIWGRFLADAAKPLLEQQQNPGNLPPVATFRLNPSNPKLGKGGTPVAIAFNALPPRMGDPQDGGSTACWKWDFGDSASGQLNVSESRTAAHTYSAAGNYTVTLEVVDDDGWAHATSSQVVTVKPPS